MAGTRKLSTSVEVGGTWYRPGTQESKIDPAHREQITNPNVWATDEDGDGVEAPEVVQSAPVYGLAPGDVPAGQLPADAGAQADEGAAAGSVRGAQRRSAPPAK